MFPSWVSKQSGSSKMRNKMVSIQFPTPCSWVSQSTSQRPGGAVPFLLLAQTLLGMARGPGKGLSLCGICHDHRTPTHKWTVLGVKPAHLFEGFNCHCTLFMAHTSIREHTHHRACVEVKEQVSGVHNVGAKDRSRTARLGGKCLYLLNLPVSPDVFQENLNIYPSSTK